MRCSQGDLRPLAPKPARQEHNRGFFTNDRFPTSVEENKNLSSPPPTSHVHTSVKQFSPTTLLTHTSLSFRGIEKHHQTKQSTEPLAVIYKPDATVASFICPEEKYGLFHF